MVDSELLLRILGQDDASDVINKVKNNVDGLSTSSKSSGQALNEISRGVRGLNNAVQTGLGLAAGKGLTELTIGNASSAETGRALIQNILDDTNRLNDAYKHFDEVTDRNLVSLNQLTPAMANFKAATGATDEQMITASDTMAKLGTYVQATTGSSALAETAMNKLSAGLHGAFAALDQYKITEASLKATGLWNGNEEDVMGYIRAIDKVIGETDQLMQTNEGLDQQIHKAFSRSGKAIGNDLLPYLKQAKQAFLNWNNNTNWNFFGDAENNPIRPAEVMIWAAGIGDGISTAVNGLGMFRTNLHSIKEGISDLRQGISSAKNVASGLWGKLKDIGGIDLGGTNLPGADMAKTTVDPSKQRGGQTGGRDWRAGREVAGEVDEVTETTGKLEGSIEKFDKESQMANLKNLAMKFVKAAIVIAGVFILVGEALFFIWGEMQIIAGIGGYYRENKANIEAGIQGIVAIAPLLIVVGAGVAVLLYAMDKVNVSIGSLVEGAVTAAVAMAIVFGLISEFLLLMIAPLLALAAVGFIYQGISSLVQSGIQGIQSVVNVFEILGPVLIPLIAAIAIISIPGLGEMIAGALAIGIPITMGLVAEFILSMVEPLAGIAALGAVSGQLQGVEQGVEAIRQVTRALMVVQVAMAAMMMINFESFGSWVASGFKSSHDQMMSLVDEGGIITGIKDFIVKFNSVTSGMQPINPASVNNLVQSANAIRLVSAAITIVQASLMMNGGLVGNTVGSVILTPMLNSVKSMAQELATFNTNINSLPIQQVDMGKVQSLVQTGQSILRIKTAVDAVKAAVSSLGQASGAAAANNGIAGVVGNALGGNNGSLKPALQQLLNAVDDVVWFNQQLASRAAAGGAAGGNAQGIQASANAVTQISNTIKQISTVLAASAVRMRSGGMNIGRNISQGIRAGVGNISSVVTPVFNTMLSGLISNSRSRGQQAGTALKTSYASAIRGMSSATSTEISTTLSTLANAVGQFRQKGYDLGQAVSQGYREGNQINSPGIIARSTAQEIVYALGFLTQGQSSMYRAGYNLGRSLVNGFGSPAFDVVNNLSKLNNVTSMGRLDGNIDLETVQSTGGDYMNSTQNKGTTIINISEGAVPVDARNMTQKESQQIMIQAFESLSGVTEVRTV